MMKSLIFVLGIFAGVNSWACDPSCAEHQSLFSQLNLLHQVAIAEQENRQTYPDYANSKRPKLTDEQMHIKFSGTGEFHCGGNVGGANLVSKNGCLALDSHTFQIHDKKGKCTGWLNREQLKKCYFQALDAKGKRFGEPRPVNPATLRITGGKNNCAANIIGNDWAVIQLRDDVPESVAVPYSTTFDFSKLGPMINNHFPKVSYRNTMDVSVVSTGAENFPDQDAPTICDGGVGFIGITGDQPELFQTNSCSGGKGASGGGVTVQKGLSEPPELFAITTSSSNSKYDHTPYGNDNYTAGIPVQGAFLQTINECQNTPATNHGVSL